MTRVVFGRFHRLVRGMIFLALPGFLVLACGKDQHKGPSGPRIVRVEPNEGSLRGGDTVILETRGFQDEFTISSPLVFFAGIPATNVRAVSGEWILAETPASGQKGPVDVTVESTGVTETAVLRGGFDYAHSSVEFFGETILLPSDSVVYVLNRSGAMSSAFGSTYVDRFGAVVTGTRWDLVIDRTISSIQSLDDLVEFNVLTFACNQAAFAPAAVPATASNKADAEVWLLGMFPWGGTGTGPGVADALTRDSSTLTFLLASSGFPNCGASGYAGHLAMILGTNTQAAAIHSFGIEERGISRALLEDIATQTGGTYTQIDP